MCAEDTPNGQWKYTDGQSWNRDTDLRITCVEQELPECSYNDQTDFEGGDLPEALGGGGLVTSATTSAGSVLGKQESIPPMPGVPDDITKSGGSKSVRAPGHHRLIWILGNALQLPRKQRPERQHWRW